ncbi:hypothetical protein L6452_08817 [Arctium lappa]|uniref:Uncharacterized protein n=1 Tax=Arctium lappa TaxID=4217 RepID=A0ACB9DIR7_ARCLA|nr:hypothetical protein L6452_08817 [Arctium lappa]
MVRPVRNPTIYFSDEDSNNVQSDNPADVSEHKDIMKIVTLYDEVVKAEFIKKIEERLQFIDLLKECFKICLNEINQKKAFAQDLLTPEKFTIQIDIADLIKKQQDAIFVIKESEAQPVQIEPQVK